MSRVLIVALLIAALTGCARSEQSLACAKLQRGQWVQVQGHWGVVVRGYDNYRAQVRFPALESTYEYRCEDLQ